jgi:hypothetical protein
MKFVPSFFFAISLVSAQFVNEVRDEARKPIVVSGKAALACNLGVSGQVLVGARSSKGGNINVKNLAGGRVLALTAAIRLRGGTGRFADSIWRGDVLSQGSLNEFKLLPEAFELPAGVAPVQSAELVVMGLVYDDQSTCGAEASATKSRFQRRVESYLKDLEEALSANKNMAPEEFEKKVRAGLLDAGPYARETSPVVNATLKKYLLTGNLALQPDARERIQSMIDQVEKYGPDRPAAPVKAPKTSKPARPARPTQ